MHIADCKAVFLTTYPIAVPRHGGQIRSAQIVKALKSIEIDVTAIGVADEAAYSPFMGPTDIAFPVHSSFRLVNGKPAPYANDYLSGVFASEDEQAYERILALLPDRIDLLFLEQPWMLPVARKLRRERDVKLLVYDSQNNETALKAPILRRFHEGAADPLIKAIKELEIAACRESDMVFAVSAADQAALSSYANTIVLLATNGIEPWQASDRELERWRQVFSKDAPNFGIYVASAHPPNYLDFFEVFGDRFGFLAPNETLCIFGGAAVPIEKLLAGRDYEALSRSRLRFPGVVDAESLAAIKELTRVFVLPILDGSGSNLKTAEAIFSSKWVVGTPTSFRGFERFTTLPHVVVANPGREFRDAVRTAMAWPPPALSEQHRQCLLDLTWERTLAPMMDAVAEKLGANRTAVSDVSPVEVKATTS
jgi:hypothetical protein